MNTILFSLSIVLQFSGAVLFIINNFANTKKMIFMSYFPSRGKGKIIEQRLIIEDEKKLIGILNDIYTNRVSFIYIAVGYITAVLGENECSHKIILTGVLILISIFLIKITKWWIKQYAEKNASTAKYMYLDIEDMINDDAEISQEYE